MKWKKEVKDLLNQVLEDHKMIILFHRASRKIEKSRRENKGNWIITSPQIAQKLKDLEDEDVL